MPLGSVLFCWDELYCFSNGQKQRMLWISNWLLVCMPRNHPIMFCLTCSKLRLFNVLSLHFPSFGWNNASFQSSVRQFFPSPAAMAMRASLPRSPSPSPTSPLSVPAANAVFYFQISPSDPVRDPQLLKSLFFERWIKLAWKMNWRWHAGESNSGDWAGLLRVRAKGRIGNCQLQATDWCRAGY